MGTPFELVSGDVGVVVSGEVGVLVSGEVGEPGVVSVGTPVEEPGDVGVLVSGEGGDVVSLGVVGAPALGGVKLLSSGVMSELPGCEGLEPDELVPGIPMLGDDMPGIIPPSIGARNSKQSSDGAPLGEVPFASVRALADEFLACDSSLWVISRTLMSKCRSKLSECNHGKKEEETEAVRVMRV